MLALDMPESATLLKIFSAITDWHFSKGFVEKVVVAGKVCLLQSNERDSPLNLNYSLYVVFKGNSDCCVRSIRPGIEKVSSGS